MEEPIKQTSSRLNKIILLSAPVIITLLIASVLIYTAFKADLENIKMGSAIFYLTEGAQTTPNDIQNYEVSLKQKLILGKEKKKASESKPSRTPDKQEGYVMTSEQGVPQDNDKFTDFGFGQNELTSEYAPDSGPEYPAQMSGQGGMEYDDNADNTTAPEPEGSKQAEGYGFLDLPKTHAPATDEDDAQGRKLPAKKAIPGDYILKLSGSVMDDMFIFGIYNNIKLGKLVMDGEYRFRPRGRRLKEKILVEFYLPPSKKKIRSQLPLILNGEIEPLSMDNGNITINDSGILTTKNPLREPTKVTYTITRRDRNSDIVYKPGPALWLDKEMECIPEEIKGFLDKAQNGPPDFKMLFISTIFNKCFGYQKNILPVKLVKGMTWGDYLDQSVSKNRRFMADCDVLSTYAVIFMRYLGIKSVVAVGYNNYLDPLDTLTAKEQHALNIAYLKNSFVFFDPSAVTPDVTGSVKIIGKNDKSPEKKDHESTTGLPEANRLRAKQYTISKNVMNFLGNNFFDSPERSDYFSTSTSAFSVLDINQNDLLAFYKEKALLRQWTSITVLIFLGLFAFSLFTKASFSFLLHVRNKFFDLSEPIEHVIMFALAKIALVTTYIIIFGQTLDPDLNSQVVPVWSLLLGSFLLVLGSLLNMTAHFTVLLEYSQHFVSEKYMLWHEHGIYKISRNPEYIGYYFMLSGACFFSWNAFVIIPAVAGIVLYTHTVKFKEISFLKHKEKEWLAYSSRTPRYL